MLTAIIWSFILGWLLLRLVHYLDRRQAKRYREQLKQRLALRGETIEQWEARKAALRYEHG